jgi:two-component system nitrate/nitrite response regulator NarL
MSHNNPTQSDQDTTTIKVAVLSDDALLRSALASLLDQHGDVEVTELDAADVALWDPGADHTNVQAKLNELAGLSKPAVALLPDAAHAQRAISAGARGVILRDRVGPHLITALRAVRGGLTVLDTPLADNLIPAAKRERGPEIVEDLTAREREVIQLLAEGLSNKLIAKGLGISQHTAKFHIGRILAKLDADTRTEAVVRALRYGLVML